MAIEYNFTLDMDRSKRDNNIAYARTGDVDSITINADLVFNGAAYTPSGTNAFFECITPNGHSVRVVASKSGSSVSVDLPSAAFQAAGVINVAYFRFETGSAEDPSYVESTEPFAIVVREGIGDNIDAGDYIEEWRQLADQLEAIVAEVEQKADQAEAAINEQKTEVDQLKAQAQTSIAQDAEDVSDAKDTAISNINGSQGAVDAAIEKLEQKTQEAVDAAQEALDGTLATNLQNEIDRTLKLDVADMVNIPDNSSLSSLINVGSYCCKTAASAATISNSPVDDSPFNMYVFSSSTSGQVMQLVVPIDLNSKPTAEWHVRFGTSSAMDPWSVIGGGADIAAGLGIDVTGDAQKTVSLDTTAFYQYHEATDVIQGSTEVTGGGRIKELIVYGNTRQNLWVNPSMTSNGITCTANADGSVKLSGTSTANLWITTKHQYSLKPSTTYTLSVGKVVSEDAAKAGFSIYEFASDGTETLHLINNGKTDVTFTTKADCVRMVCGFLAYTGVTVSGTYRVMLNEGSEAEPWCPPGLNGVDELSVVTAGKNLLTRMGLSLPQTYAGITFSDNGDSGIRISGTATNTAYYNFFNTSLGTAPFVPAGEYVASLAGMTDGVNFTVGYFDYGIGGDHTNWMSLFAGNATGSIDRPVYLRPFISVVSGTTLDTVVYPQLELGSTATAYESPVVTTTPIDLDGNSINSLPDGTRDELHVDSDGSVTLTQRVGAVTIPTDADEVRWDKDRISFVSPNSADCVAYPQGLMCDVVPPRLNAGYTHSYCITTDAKQSYTAFVKVEGSTSTADTCAKVGGGTILYKLETPKTIAIPDVSLPELASISYTVYASSNIPVEIEADVVKVDYLPPSDVYTKKEVDQKIDDAGMPDVVPVSQGGTGVTTAAAERNRLGLGNTTGALPVANGGTGKTTAKAAQNALLADINSVSDDASDETIFVGYYSSPSDANGALYKRAAPYIWNWIVSKIRSTFGFSSSNVLPVANGGTGLTENPSALVNLGSESASNVLTSSPRPGVTGTLPVSHGGTGATAPGVGMLSNLGITFGTADPPSTGTPGSIYIQYFK